MNCRKSGFFFTVLMLFAFCLIGTRITASDGQSYKNARYSYLIMVPTSLVWSGESDNGDGQKFFSKDKKFEIAVYGRNNVLEENISELFRKSFSSSQGITNKESDSSSYKIQGKKDGTIYIEKTFAKNETVITCFVTYPENAEQEYKSMADNVISSFGFNSESPVQKISLGLSNGDNVNVRSGHGEDYKNFKILYQLKKGDEVEILGEDGDWWRITSAKSSATSNVEQWVMKKFINCAGQENTTDSEAVDSVSEIPLAAAPEKIREMAEKLSGKCQYCGQNQSPVVVDEAPDYFLCCSKCRKILFQASIANNTSGTISSEKENEAIQDGVNPIPIADQSSQIMPLSLEEITKFMTEQQAFLTSKMKAREMKVMYSRSEEGQKIFRSIPFRVAKEMGFNLDASLNQYFLRANKEDLTGEEAAALVMLCGAMSVDINKNDNSLQAINRLASDGAISKETKAVWEKFLGTAIVPNPIGGR